MIDFLLGSAFGAVAVFLIYHFGPGALKTYLTSFEQRIQKMLSDAFNQAIARLESAVDAKVAASDTGAAVDAEATASVNALADKLSAPAAE